MQASFANEILVAGRAPAIHPAELYRLLRPISGRMPQYERHDGNIPRLPVIPEGREELGVRTKPITGEQGDLFFLKGYGCSGTVASATMNLMRSGTVGLYDLEDDSGMRNTRGVTVHGSATRAVFSAVCEGDSPIFAASPGGRWDKSPFVPRKSGQSPVNGYLEAGSPQRAVVRDFRVTAERELSIEFLPRVGEPSLSGLEVIRAK